MDSNHSPWASHHSYSRPLSYYPYHQLEFLTRSFCALGGIRTHDSILSRCSKNRTWIFPFGIQKHFTVMSNCIKGCTLPAELRAQVKVIVMPHHITMAKTMLPSVSLQLTLTLLRELFVCRFVCYSDVLFIVRQHNWQHCIVCCGLDCYYHIGILARY